MSPSPYVISAEAEEDQSAAEFRAAKRKADKGDTSAMVKVGSMYLQGEGVNANYEEAWKYFARAANKGNVDGLIGIGSLYREGKGVAEDYALAEEWFMKAVNRGSVPGMLAIGALYQEGGTNMGANYKRAAEWYKKAAYEGSKEGAEALAHLYFDGDRYFPKDYYKSYVWCCIADMAEKSGLATDAAIVGGAAALVFSGPLLPIVGLAYLWGDWNTEYSIKEQIEGVGIFNLAKLSDSQMDKAKMEAGRIMGEIEANVKSRREK